MRIRPFELGLIITFLLAAVGGLVFFRLYEPSNSEENTALAAGVTIWGVFDQQLMNSYLSELTKSNKEFVTVKYEQIDGRNFNNVFIEAIAEERAPDLLMIPHTMLVSLRTKLMVTSYTDFPERTFRDTYIDGASIFALNDGIYGFPIAADPLVLFWNKDIFATAGLAQPPKTWEQISNETVRTLVKKDDTRNITQSALAFGEFVNVTHAHSILAMLFLQTGNPIVREEGEGYRVVMGETNGQSLPPAESVLSFYTQFADRNKELFSWNRAKQSDRAEFLRGTLAMYFGKGSEYHTIARDNPNISFDIAPVPQGSNVTIKKNYADFYAFAVPRAAKNPQGAYAAGQIMGSGEPIVNLVNILNLAPVHRAAYATPETDVVKSVVYQSTLISSGWLDPSPRESEAIFREMVERIISGGGRLTNVVNDGINELENLF